MKPQRRAKRVPINHDGMAYNTGGKQIAPCRVRNISVSGAQLEFSREPELPKTFLLSLSPNGEVVRRCNIVWQYSTVVGVRFEDGVFELR
jgi:PilZ domain